MKKILEWVVNSFVIKLFISVIVVLAILASIFIYKTPDGQLTKLLNSNYFVALVTGTTGILAFSIYFKQRSDNKRDAAKTLLAEMINAEKVIKKVKNKKEYSDSGKINLGDDPMKFYLGNFSWDKYKYLFIGDFDSYEWEKINLYFSQCNTFNETIKGIADLLPKNIEYRIQYTQEYLGKIALEQAEEAAMLEIPSVSEVDKYKKYQEELSKITEKYKKKSNNFIVGYIEGDNSPMKYSYSPVNNYTPLDRDLDKIDTRISKSSIGKKLEKLAR